MLELRRDNERLSSERRRSERDREKRGTARATKHNIEREAGGEQQVSRGEARELAIKERTRATVRVVALERGLQRAKGHRRRCCVCSLCTLIVCLTLSHAATTIRLRSQIRNTSTGDTAPISLSCSLPTTSKEPDELPYSWSSEH